jgi:hypothetical protein
MLSGIKEVLDKCNNPEAILRMSAVELCGKDTTYEKKRMHQQQKLKRVIDTTISY